MLAFFPSSAGVPPPPGLAGRHRHSGDPASGRPRSLKPSTGGTGTPYLSALQRTKEMGEAKTGYPSAVSTDPSLTGAHKAQTSPRFKQRGPRQPSPASRPGPFHTCATRCFTARYRRVPAPRCTVGGRLRLVERPEGPGQALAPPRRVFSARRRDGVAVVAAARVLRAAPAASRRRRVQPVPGQRLHLHAARRPQGVLLPAHAQGGLARARVSGRAGRPRGRPERAGERASDGPSSMAGLTGDGRGGSAAGRGSPLLSWGPRTPRPAPSRCRSRVAAPSRMCAVPAVPPALCIAERSMAGICGGGKPPEFLQGIYNYSQ